PPELRPLQLSRLGHAARLARVQTLEIAGPRAGLLVSGVVAHDELLPVMRARCLGHQAIRRNACRTNVCSITPATAALIPQAICTRRARSGACSSPGSA